MKKSFCILGLLFLLFVDGKCQKNILINGDFEHGIPVGEFPTDGWTPSWYPKAAGAITTSTAAQSGKAGLWLYTSSGNSFVRIFQDINCVPGLYKAEVFFRTPEIKNWSHANAFLILTFVNSFGRAISSESTDTLKVANTEWHSFSRKVKVPRECTKVRYTLNLESTNTQSVLNADNCSFVKMNEK